VTSCRDGKDHRLGERGTGAQLEQHSGGLDRGKGQGKQGAPERLGGAAGQEALLRAAGASGEAQGRTGTGIQRELGRRGRVLTIMHAGQDLHDSDAVTHARVVKALECQAE
jgi:hypothetical protein